LRFQCCFGQLLGQSLVHCWLIGKQKVATHFQKQCLAINVGLAVFHSSFKFIELFFVVMLVFGVFVLRLLRLKFQHVSKENVSNLGYFLCLGGPLRIKSLRRKHVVQLARNPKSKVRHEAVDVKMYTSKSSSKYVDFRQDRRVWNFCHLKFCSPKGIHKLFNSQTLN
jgi:hypothetical protein